MLNQAAVSTFYCVNSVVLLTVWLFAISSAWEQNFTLRFKHQRFIDYVPP